MAKLSAPHRSINHRKVQQGPDVGQYLWLLITGLSLLGSSLFILFARH